MFHNPLLEKEEIKKSETKSSTVIRNRINDDYIPANITIDHLESFQSGNFLETFGDAFGNEIAAVVELQGQHRSSQEDAHNVGFAESFHELNEEERISVLKLTVQRLHEKIINLPKKLAELANEGSTFSMVLICNERTYIVNIGDSCLFFAIKDDKGKITVRSLTKQWHNTSNPSEYKRIEDAGLSITKNRISRSLQVSRAFGDKDVFHIPYTLDSLTSKSAWERGFFCEPDITSESINPYPLPAGYNAIVFNVCDGPLEHIIKNKKESKKSADPIKASEAHLQQLLTTAWTEDATTIDLAKAIRNDAVENRSKDNMTIMALKVKATPTNITRVLVLCDGHGGMRLSNFVAENVFKILNKEIKNCLAHKQKLINKPSKEQESSAKAIKDSLLAGRLLFTLASEASAPKKSKQQVDAPQISR